MDEERAPLLLDLFHYYPNASDARTIVVLNDGVPTVDHHDIRCQAREHNIPQDRYVSCGMSEKRCKCKQLDRVANMLDGVDPCLYMTN
jgi:hypothetical protein